MIKTILNAAGYALGFAFCSAFCAFIILCLFA